MSKLTESIVEDAFVAWLEALDSAIFLQLLGRAADESNYYIQIQ
ncbi:MAG: hypothetical protein WCD07_05790 [Burkholderiales bacterium]